MKIAKECNFEFFRRKTYLITDSKGDCIRRVAPSIERFEIVNKKERHVVIQTLAEKIKEDIKPVILISFGTCELTAKKGKYIYLRQPHTKM